MVKPSFDFYAEFQALVSQYKEHPFVAITKSEVSTQLELLPVEGNQCYMSVRVDVEGNVEILVDGDATFDNLVYDDKVIRQAISDVLTGNVNKIETRLLGFVYESKVHLLGSGLRHTVTFPWLFPALVFPKRVTKTKFSSYLN